MRFPEVFLPARRLGRVVAFAGLMAGMASAQTSVQIHDVMKNLPNSPYLGQTVSVSGVVVGVMSTGGFYITGADGTWDSDPTTAEGMPIFAAAGANPPCAVVGNIVTIVGPVSNSTALNAANTPGTGITPTSCTVTGTGTVTQNIALPTSITAFGQLLPYTGMPATNATLYAIAPTGGTLDEPNEIVTSSGQFFGTDSTPGKYGHLFRSMGIGGDEYVPPVANAATIPRWSGNPQRILIDTTTFGGPPMDIGAGQTLVCTVPAGITLGATTGVGVMDYTLGYARLLLFQTTVCTITGTITPAVSAPADAQHFHVGSLNLYRFYNTVGNNVGAVAITPAAYARRLTKAANAIVNYIGKPDILALEEVQDLETLTDISNAVNTLAGTTYTPYLAVGNDPDSLNMGFLVNTTTVVVDSFTQVGLNDTYTTVSGGSALLWERPPQVLVAEVKRAGLNYQVSVIHQDPTLRAGSGDPVLGPDIRARRAAQAGALSQLVQTHQSAGENILVAGNFNEYSFNDGYVDLVNVIIGTPVDPSMVATYEPSVTSPTLYNFEGSVASGTKYNIIESGNSRSIEHMLVTTTNTNTATAPLSTYASTITQSHFTTDFPAVDANDVTTAAGLTPHDGFVAAFLIPPVPTTAAVSPAKVDFGSITYGLSTTQTITVTNTTQQPSKVDVSSITFSGANASDFSQTSNCTTLAEGASCNIVVTFTPGAVGARSGTMTVITDSAINPTLTVSLIGTGLNTTATMTPASAAFPSTFVGGGVSAAQNFTVTNTSPLAINITGVSVTAGFNQSNNCGSSLPANGSCAVAVVFAPQSVGANTGTLTVTTSTTADPTLTASLTGTGLPTTATLTPATVAFANTILGFTSPTQTLTWTNTSGIALKVNGVSVTGDFRVVNTACNGSIAANASCTTAVTFAPTAVGTRTGTFTVQSASSANPTLTSTLTGIGVGDVVTSASTLNFGNVDITAHSKTQTIVITNYTSSAIGLTSMSIQGDFAYTTTCGASLPGSSSCNVNVVFTPTVTGPRSGTFTVNTTDKNTPVLTVLLNGNGVDFTIATTAGPDTIIAGFSININATVTPVAGFSAPITMSCTTDAAGSVCQADPNYFPLSAPTPVAFNISTTSQYTVIGYGGFGGRPWMLLLAMLSCAAILVRRSRAPWATRFAGLGMLLVAVVMTSGGCSGRLPDRNANPTLPGTYHYTLTATDGYLTHSTTYTLNVVAK